MLHHVPVALVNLTFKITIIVQRGNWSKKAIQHTIMELKQFQSRSLCGRSVLQDLLVIFAFLCDFQCKITCFCDERGSQLSREAIWFFHDFYLKHNNYVSIDCVPFVGGNSCHQRYEKNKVFVVVGELWQFLVILA